MKIYIENLTFYCIIGLLSFERKNKQKVIVDCKIKYDYKNKNFVDYSKIAQDIEKIMKKEKFKLIEEANLYLKKYIKNNYKIEKVQIKIKKPDIINNCEVSVES